MGCSVAYSTQGSGSSATIQMILTPYKNLAANTAYWITVTTNHGTGTGDGIQWPTESGTFRIDVTVAS